MSSPLKIVLGIVAAVALILVVVMTLIVSNLDRLVKTVVEEVGSDVAGVPVTLASAEISLTDGRGTLRGLAIGNPPGFDADKAFELDAISIAVDLDSLAGDVVVLSEVLVDGARVNFEQNSSRNNLKTLQDNLGSGADSSSSQEGDVKLIVHLFRFSNGEITASVAGLEQARQVAIPTVEVREVGRKSAGATAGEVARALLEPVVRGALSAATSAVSDAAVDALKDSAKEKAQEQIDEAKDKLKGLLGRD